MILGRPIGFFISSISVLCLSIAIINFVTGSHSFSRRTVDEGFSLGLLVTALLGLGVGIYFVAIGDNE